MTTRMAPRVSLIYALIGLAWIGGSTLLVWVNTPEEFALVKFLELIKGMAFVVVTAGVIYWLVSHGERQLEEKSARKADLHRHLRNLLDGSKDLIAAWNCQRQYTTMNLNFQDMCQKFFGIRPEVGTSLVGMVGHIPDKLAEFDRCWDRTLAGESFVEIQCVDLKGERLWYETSYGCLRNELGTVVGGFHIIRDTTDRRRAEYALQQREQRLQSIVDNLADYVVVIDRDLNCRYCSAGITRVTGFSVAEALDQSLASIIHPDDIATIRSLVADDIGSGERVRDLQYRRLHVDGRWHYHSMNGGWVEQDGEIQFLAVIQDIEERKRAESRLAHSAKLSTMGEFAAGLIHELAHPVAVIRLAAESALDHSLESKSRDSFLHEQIELVDDQAKRMASMIEHIRAFSRSGNGSDILFSPQMVLRSVERMISRQLDMDGIALKVDICDTDLMISGSPLRLEEVLLNLISNARAAIGTRRLADGVGYRGEIVLTCHCGDDEALITVRDNGCGMPPVELSRIFEPFFTTKDIGEGLGLGLSISLTIVKSLGGQISVTAEPGVTAFQLTLPVAQSMSP